MTFFYFIFIYFAMKLRFQESHGGQTIPNLYLFTVVPWGTHFNAKWDVIHHNARHFPLEVLRQFRVYLPTLHPIKGFQPVCDHCPLIERDPIQHSFWESWQFYLISITSDQERNSEEISSKEILWVYNVLRTLRQRVTVFHCNYTVITIQENDLVSLMYST